MCGIELMFYSECFGSRGPRGLAGGRKTHSPEKLLSPLLFPFPPTPAKNPSLHFQEPLEHTRESGSGYHFSLGLIYDSSQTPGCSEGCTGQDLPLPGFDPQPQ